MQEWNLELFCALVYRYETKRLDIQSKIIIIIIIIIIIMTMTMTMTMTMIMIMIMIIIIVLFAKASELQQNFYIQKPFYCAS